MGRRVLWRAVVLQALLVVGALVVCEIVLRVIDLRYLRVMAGGAEGIYQYDAELGWLPFPSSNFTYRTTRTVNVQTNSLGLRDIEPDDSTKPTIAVVGDSFVWGYDVEASDRFTDILRRKLNQYRIVNVSVSGYGTDQEYLLLKRLWPRIMPDVVILVVCVDNDRQDNSTNSRYDGPYKPYLVKNADGVLSFAGIPTPWSRQLYFEHYWLVKHSWLARVVMSAYVLLHDPIVTVPDPTEALIDLMRDFVRWHGAKLVVGLQYHEPRLEALLRRRDVPFVTFDGADHFRGDGDHWTPQGHALVADRIAPLVSELRVATTSSRPPQ